MSGEAQNKLDDFITNRFTHQDKFDQFASLIIGAAVERVNAAVAPQGEVSEDALKRIKDHVENNMPHEQADRMYYFGKLLLSLAPQGAAKPAPVVFVGGTSWTADCVKALLTRDAKLTADLAKANDDHTAVQFVLNDLHADYVQYRTDTGKLRDAASQEIDRLKLRADNLTADRDRLATRLAALRLERNTTNAGNMEEIDNLMREVTKLKDANDVKIGELAWVAKLNANQAETIKRQRGDLDAAQSRIRALCAENQSLDNKLAVLRADRDALESVKEDFKAANAEQAREIGLLRAANTKLADHLGRMGYDYPGIAPQGEPKADYHPFHSI